MDVLTRPPGSAIVLWCLALVVFMLLQLAMRARIFNGARFLETRLRGYSAAEVHEFLKALGPLGGPWYIVLQVFDVAFIVSFAGAMLQTDRWSLARMAMSGNAVQWIMWLPPVYAVLDLTENLTLAGLVVVRRRSDALSRLASLSTRAKAVSGVTSLIATVAVVLSSLLPVAH
jgi:hypothetical protein